MFDSSCLSYLLMYLMGLFNDSCSNSEDMLMKEVGRDLFQLQSRNFLTGTERNLSGKVTLSV
jgi:hypothetical protein